jgi:hypothetical protein
MSAVNAVADRVVRSLVDTRKEKRSTTAALSERGYILVGGAERPRKT